MHWAIDRFGEVVAATDFVVYSAPFTCPACGEPVHHRSGSERKAHFAHYHLGSDWLCENYSPGEAGASSGERALPLSGSRSSARIAFPGAGAKLCIENAETRHANLLLRMPASWAISSATSMTIVSSFGRQQILSKDLKKRKFVRLPWSVPIGTCEVTDDYDGIELDINEALKSFRHNGNFFLSVHDRGVLLDETEELEVGCSYWLIAQRVPALADLPRSINVERLDGPGVGWQKIRLQLTDCDRSHANIAAIERVFGRRIRLPKGRPRVIWPMPVRFSPDGVAVYGHEAKEFEVEWKGEGDLTVEKDGVNVEVSNTSIPGHFAIGNLGDGEYALRVEGVFASLLRIESTDPFRPAGVQVKAGDQSNELFEYENLSDLTQGRSDVRITVPVLRLWRTSSINGLKGKKIPDGKDSPIDDDILDVDFGAFGVVPVPRIPKANDTDIETNATKSEPLALMGGASLRGIALRFGGSVPARELQRLKSIDDCLRWADQYQLQWMLPYLVRSFCKGCEK